MMEKSKQSKLDLSLCDEEPIHIPETIQPHGALLVLDENNVIVRVSENINEIVKLDLLNSIGQHLNSVLGEFYASKIELTKFQLFSRKLHSIQIRTFIEQSIYTSSVYLSNQYCVIELIPDLIKRKSYEKDFQRIINQLVAIKQKKNINDKLQGFADLIKSISQLNRVMIYQFDDHNNGEVLSESKEDSMESLVGLHYPASDIPPQARELYLKNTVRVLADVHYTPTPLTEPGNDNLDDKLDMSMGVLRSVSPYHIQYLKNMGVRATIVASITINDKLWGLISCHHHSPIEYDAGLVEVFKWISLIISDEVKISEYAERELLINHTESVLISLGNKNHSLFDLFNPKYGPLLLAITNADGVACYLDGKISQYGLTPSEKDTLSIHQSILQNNQSSLKNVFVSNAIPSLFNEPIEKHPFSTGIIAIPVSEDVNNTIMFFRQEEMKTVNWGGDPNKAINIEGDKLTPRASFKLWQEKIEGQSKKWSVPEIESATYFAAAIDIELKNRILKENQLLRRSIDQLNDMVIITEAESIEKPGPRITFINEALVEETGYSRDEIIGRNPRMFQGVNTSRETLNEMKTHLKNWDDFRVELMNYRKNGTQYWTEIDLSPIADDSGIYTHWVSVQRNITQRKLVEDLLKFIVNKDWHTQGESFFNKIASYFLNVLDIEYIVIGIVTNDCSTITTDTVFRRSGKLDNFSYSLKNTPCQNVVGKSMCIHKSAVQEMFPDDLMLKKLGIQSYVGYPLFSTDNKPLGVIALMDTKPMVNTAIAEAMLRAVSSSIEAELIRKSSADVIWHQANYDLLTDLPNRRMFQDRLMQEVKNANRTKIPSVLLLLDLDNFKEVNDSLGHDIGDLLLVEVADRLRSCVRDTDVVARLGGDEFTIILSNIPDMTIAERFSTSILNKLASPYKIKENIIYLTCSIGITVYPNDANSIDELIKCADQAMYASKKSGRNRYSFFTASMQEKTLYKLKLANDLRSALENNELSLAYQPIVCLSNGAIMKAEALIRWQHPELGNISPAEFIPIAEESGIIHSIGEWVFREAVFEVKRIMSLTDSFFQISINKSPIQFQSKKTTHLDWFEFIRSNGLSPKNIAIEITEGVLMDDEKDTIDILSEMHDSGMEISIDDFGTGYSAMAYLKKYDVDYIKIDQEFVRFLKEDSDDMALCEAIIVMGHKLGMKIIAEGIETEEQMKLLKKAGADYGQGYYFSKPIKASDFEELILKNE
jgi:diguanylate cyclase (GGDEF)-like protein/PAS domain S-box-containing protein